jgi:hypothetical protein
MPLIACIGRLIVEATHADLDVYDAMLYVVGTGY